VDRGPKITEVLKLVMGMVKSGIALCVPGNHDVKLLRKLNGRDVQITMVWIELWNSLRKNHRNLLKR